MSKACITRVLNVVSLTSISTREIQMHTQAQERPVHTLVIQKRIFMDHWKKVIYLPLVAESYNQLVYDHNTITHQKLDYCDFEGSENRLQFHKANRKEFT